MKEVTMRDSIDIVIPVAVVTAQLEKTVQLVRKHTTNVNLRVEIDPDLNVAEARQKAMDNTRSRYVCFLDYDSEMIADGWLDKLHSVIDSSPGVVAVFGNELWGNQESCTPQPPRVEIPWGPSCCMLIDRTRVPADVKWNADVGLRTGFIGGDFEEVEYCYQLRHKGLSLIGCGDVLFRHTGGKTTHEAFSRTDRCRGIRVMMNLLQIKAHVAPEDRDFFKGLKYVPADPDDDTKLASGYTLRECYKDVVARNGLSRNQDFIEMGLT